MRELYEMLIGRAEFLGLTSGGKGEVLPYDPNFMAKLQAGR